MESTFDLRTMQAQAWPSYDELPGSLDDYVLEPKLDGFRLVAHVHEDHVDFFTRSLKSQNGKIPYIEKELLAAFPAGTVLDGEIVALFQNEDGTYNNDFEHVQSVMISKPDVAVMKARTIRPVSYVIFDMTYECGEDTRHLRCDDRRLGLQLHLDLANPMEHVSLIAQWPASQQMHDTLVKMGFEGSIAKKKTSTYANGKRGRKYGWFKFKAEATLDAVVLGFLDSKMEGSRHETTFGSILFGHPYSSMPHEIVQHGLNDVKWAKKNLEMIWVDEKLYVVRGSCAGILDEERIRLHKELKPGDVIEVKYNTVYPDGVRLRHPQYLRQRFDRSAQDIHWHDK
jgi:bifunctional non-homologous end joining protein LigD